MRERWRMGMRLPIRRRAEMVAAADVWVAERVRLRRMVLMPMRAVSMCDAMVRARVCVCARVAVKAKIIVVASMHDADAVVAAIAVGFAPPVRRDARRIAPMRLRRDACDASQLGRATLSRGALAESVVEFTPRIRLFGDAHTPKMGLSSVYMYC